MHRSGTSALSGVACSLGASAPNNLLPANFANPNGYWESLPLVHAHTELLASADSSWDDWRQLDPRWYGSEDAPRFHRRIRDILESEYEEKPLFVVKDPRLCRFLPFFLSVLKEMAVTPVALHSLRDPLEVAFSLRRRDGFPISKSVALWLRHVLEAELHSREMPRCTVCYESLLKDWRLEMSRAGGATGVAWPADFETSATSIEKFLVRDLHHERNESAGVQKHPDLQFLAGETYQLLLAASTARADRDLFPQFDAVRAKFDEASEFFGAILRTEQVSVQEAQKKQEQVRRRELDRQIDQNTRERIAHAARVDALSGQLEKLHDTSTKNESRLNLVIAELSAALDRKTGEHAHLLADFELSKSALEDARASLAANHDLSERLASELKQVRARHEDLQADISCKKVTIDDMNREISAHRKHAGNLQTLLVDRNEQNQEMMIRIEALYASRSWRMTGPLRAARRFFSKVTSPSRSVG
jgi:hypothetical protein